MDGFHRGLEQDPTENEYSYGESDLPCPCRLWTPPKQRQCQRPYTTDCNYNKRFPIIPLNLFLCKARAVEGIQKLTAVFTLYRVVLNFFSAEGTLFHYHFLEKNAALNQLGLAPAKPGLSSRAYSMMGPYILYGQISLIVGKYVRYLVTSRVIKSRSSTAACAPI
jgi:hypothetical protein